jgi:hypothetical protein
MQKPGLKTILGSVVKPKIKCIHCKAECPPSCTAYLNWCDDCFLSPPLGHRYRKTTPEDIKKMLDYQQKTKACVATKKERKKAFADANNANQEQNKGKKRAATKDNDSNGDDDLIFNYQKD